MIGKMIEEGRRGCRWGFNAADYVADCIADHLADYIAALKIDEEALEGPNLLEKVIYGTPRPALVRGRAIYLQKQLALPEDQRLMRVPEKDADQRMYKPF